MEYTYDEQGRLATRVNYNNFGGEFTLGGLLDYTYDDAGNLLKVSTYWDLNKTMLFSEEEYTYENGVNVLMTTTVHNFSGASVISKLEKKYDDKNRLIERINYDKDANTSELVKRSIISTSGMTAELSPKGSILFLALRWTGKSTTTMRLPFPV